jgi:uncharacterized Zn finger protein
MRVIEAVCPLCEAEGEHPVLSDNGKEVEAVCDFCGCLIHIVL